MNNIFYIVALVIAAIIALLSSYKIFGVDKVRNWLLWAVTVAESKYGSGTGKLKLMFVYDMFTSKFTKLQVIIPYKLFEKLVDQALVTMRKALENERIADYVKAAMINE